MNTKEKIEHQFQEKPFKRTKVIIQIGDKVEMEFNGIIEEGTPFEVTIQGQTYSFTF